MLIPFERWIKSQEFDRNAISLFEEAITCHKTGTYRAALMLSYLAFMSCLKRRIMMSSAPKDFLDTEWRAGVQQKLQDDETWDKTLFDFTQQKAPKKPIFDISEDLRDQIKYWKNRRNDCAHAKDNAIEHFHIEAFWSFLQSNLPKLVVGGGMPNLLNRIRFHFDISLTPLNADYADIIADIQHAVPQKSMQMFFADAGNIISGLSGGKAFIAKPHRHLEFFESIFKQFGDGSVTDELATFIKADKARLGDFIYHYPGQMIRLKLDSGYIRSYWWNSAGYMDYMKVKVVFAMLRLQMIPKNEIGELRSLMLETGHFSISEADAMILKEIDFWKDFYNKYIAAGSAIGNYDEGNRLASLFIIYLQEFPIGKELVQVLCRTFNLSYYPFTLLECLKSFFSENPAKVSEFEEVMRQESISAPSTSFLR